MASIEQACLDEINRARTEPDKYAALLQPMLSCFEGTLLKLPGKTPLRTNEGIAAVQEAITFLQTTAPVSPLQRLSAGLTAAAADHVADMQKHALTGHTGSDGSSPFDRMSRHGAWQGSAAENIAYGSEEGGSARDRTIQLIIDDGVSNRGHRSNIFNPNFKVLGVAEGPHPKLGRSLCTTFAGGYAEGGASAGASSGDDVAATTAGLAAASLSTSAVPSAAATPKAPPGGKVSVSTSTVVEGKKKTTTTTTVVTDAAGNKRTTVQTKVETSG